MHYGALGLGIREFLENKQAKEEAKEGLWTQSAPRPTLEYELHRSPAKSTGSAPAFRAWHCYDAPTA